MQTTMQIPEKALEGLMKLRDSVIKHYPIQNNQEDRRTNISLNYYNELSHFVMINIYFNNIEYYNYAGIIDNDSLNSQIDTCIGLSVGPSSVDMNFANSFLSINRKFTGLNTLYDMSKDGSYHNNYIKVDESGITCSIIINTYNSINTLDIYSDYTAEDTVSETNEKITKICNKILNKFIELEHNIDGYNIYIDSSVKYIHFQISTKTKNGININSMCSLSYDDIFSYDDIEIDLAELDNTRSMPNDAYQLAEKDDNVLLCIPKINGTDTNIDSITCHDVLFEVNSKFLKNSWSIDEGRAYILRKVKNND